MELLVGILAGITAMTNKNDKILIARNSHKSVYNAVEINSLVPIYLYPKQDEYGINKEIEPKDVKEKLENNKDIKLLVITSPTYEGVISNIKEIVEIAHSYKVPVLVDEAHGAHLKFDRKLKEFEALKGGADIVVQSLHKTLPSLTQTALLHIQGNIVQENEIYNALSIFETSSPSYILMASIDNCLNILEKDREKLFKAYNENLEKFYERTKNLEKLKILGQVITKNDIQDMGKIVVITKNTNINGKKLAETLREKYKIEVEMAYTDYIIAMTSICDKKENFEKFADALIKIDKEVQKIEEKEIKSQEFYIIPKKEMEIYETKKSKDKIKTIYKKAEGKISNEYIFVYPPGIPYITPGEVIDKNVISKIEEFMKNGIEIRTTSNSFPEIEIIEND